MRVHRLSFLVIFLTGGAAFAQVPVTHQPHVHDPCIIASGNYFYVYSTGWRLPSFRSTDLYNWTWCGPVFGPNPAWALKAVPGVTNPWAPDISFFDGTYHLYYSMSTFGNNRSSIGLTINQTLDPADPKYKWVDQGEVFSSSPRDDFNAIDPNLIMDEKDRPWLVLGSCWGGVRLKRLDRATGKPSADDSTLYALATRPEHKLIEGPFVVRHDGYFYMFVSFDACCRGAKSTYKTMAGRSRSITGPYLDMDRTPMLRGGGSLVIAGQGDIRGPGHNAVLTGALGRDWIVHHFYDASDRGRSKLQVRQLCWDENGWPLAGDPVVAAVKPATPRTDTDTVDLAGEWNLSTDFGAERLITFSRGQSVASNGKLNLKAGNGFPAIRCIVSDDASWFTGHDATGRIVRGRRTHKVASASN